MKIKTSAKALKGAISKLKLLPNTQLLAGSILIIQVDEMDGMTIARRTGNYEAELQIDCETDGSGFLYLDMSFLDNAATGTEDVIEIESSGRLSVVVKNGKRKTTITQFPEQEVIAKAAASDTNKTTTLPVEVLIEAIRVCSNATAEDKGREDLMHMDIRRVGKNISFVATDGRRAHVYTPDIEIKVEAVIPSVAIRCLRSMFEQEEKIILTETGSGAITFASGGTRILCPKVEAKTPSLDKMLDIPEASNIIKFNRSEFAAAIKAAVPFGGNNRIVTIKTAQGIAMIEAGEEADSKARTSTEVNCECKAPGDSMSFRSDYFIDMLDAIGTNEIELEWIADRSCFHYKDAERQIMLMGIRIQPSSAK